MTSGIEGVGEAVSGGMLAAAVEPGAGANGEDRGGNCLNCGAALTGAYCHQCGQKGHVHRTLRAFGHDLMHGVLHFEGKIWRTLPMLAWHPGALTRRYIDGERARFVSPLALFLFSVFLMFAVFSAIGGPFHANVTPMTSAQSLQDVRREAASLGTRAATLTRQRAALIARRQSTGEVDEALAELRGDQRDLDRAERLLRAAATHGPGAAPVEADLSDFRVQTPWPWLNHGLEEARANPSLLAYKLQTDAYKFSWALIPISVPFVWLMFAWRRRYKLYDHTVFVTYSIAFMTLLVVALSLLRPLTGSDALGALALTFVPPVHMYRQLKGAYALRTFSALWRTIALLIFALIAGTLFFLLLLTLGLLG